METLSEPRICGSEEDLLDYVYLVLKRQAATRRHRSEQIRLRSKKCEVQSCTTSTSCMVLEIKAMLVTKSKHFINRPK